MFLNVAKNENETAEDIKETCLLHIKLHDYIGAMSQNAVD
jgi:hypothetical protein